MATMIIPSKAYGARAKKSAPHGLFARLMSALKTARQHEADEIAAQYMTGRWSDSVEREVNERLTHAELHRLF